MKIAKAIAVFAGIALLWVGGYLLANAGDVTTDLPSAGSTTAAITDSATIKPHKVMAYYFHGNVRCATCRRIEAFTREAIDSGFVTDLKSGDLEFRAVNIDSSQNKHFVNDYQLYTRSVVLTDLHQGKQTRWKNLDKVWMLSGKKAEFMKYIQSEVSAFLDPKQ